MSKLKKIKEIIFSNTDQAFDDVSVKSLNNNMVEIVKGDKHYVFLIKDILTISMGRDKEENEASLQIKLANDNYCIEFSGSNNAITKLYISINMQWQLFRNKKTHGAILKWMGLTLTIFVSICILAAGASNSINSATNKSQIALNENEKNEIKNDQDQTFLATSKDPLLERIDKLSEPNIRLADLLKKGVATKDYSVKLGDNTKNDKLFFVFSDPQCPNCRKIEHLLEEVLDSYSVEIFPVSKIGRDSSRELVSKVLCAESTTRRSIWQSVMSGSLVDQESCKNGYIATDNNNATYDAFGFIGTPAIVREDGAVFPPTKQLTEASLRAWLTEAVQ